MSTRQIHVFISHSWKHHGHYEKISEWVFEKNWSIGQASLNLLNYSVPKTNPIVGMRTIPQLRQAITAKISRSHVVIIPSGMYASQSRWIGEEIKAAKLYEKPILSVNPRAQERKSRIVTGNATREVGWNSNSIVSGIWQLYRDSR